ncbi:MAG: acyl-CoA dehydrogenase family protein [Protaetiibacter sp.]
MNGTLSSEATELGAIVAERIAEAGGYEFLRAVVDDPARRVEAGEMLGELGLWELGSLDGALELEIAAAASRAAGTFSFPYPVVERLAAGSDDAAVSMVARRGPRVAMHLDLPLAWRGIDLTGAEYRVVAVTSLLGTKAAPFGVTLAADVTGNRDVRAAAVTTTLHSWWLLGTLDRATEDTVRYTHERMQFGRTLDRFQSVAFRLADMTLAVRSLEELGKYTLWSIARGDDEGAGLVDALALRVAALEAADIVIRGAHQLHGAMGFTDEVPVSWMSRMSQGVRRLPEDRTRTLGMLTGLAGTDGLGELGRPERVVESI